MSEYLSKKAVLEWLIEQYFHGMGEEAWNTAISKLQEKIESGAFDADESEGTWKATAEVLGRENAQMNTEIQRMRAALEKIIERAKDESKSQDRQLCHIENIAAEALSTTSEPTGAERAKAAIADRYKNALHGWHNPVDRAAGSYYNGYLNGVGDTLRLLDITIPGINAPEGDGNDA